MPSAASAKLEKQVSSGARTESSDNNNTNNSPIRQALVIIEHKIRNLEKRKTKLESYRAIQSSGKELSADQKAAVAKFDEVAQSLEFARELSKQVLQLATNAEKEQKKQARKELIVRAQAETVKIREVLTIQNILSSFNDAQVREDFLNGTNGAAKLEEEDLSILEKFYIDIQVKRQTTPEDVPFLAGAQKAAEYLSFTIDGRPKQYGESTFENIKRILNSIQECGYLDRAGKLMDSGEEVAENEEENDEEIEEGKTKHETTMQEEEEEGEIEIGSNTVQQQSIPPVSNIPQSNAGQPIDVPKFPTEAPSAAAVPAPSFPQQPQQQSQPTLVSTQIPSQPPPQMPMSVVAAQVVAVSVAQAPVAPGPPAVVGPNPGNPLHTGHFPPTTVRAVEQAYFKQHQYIQQMRPLADVIGSGNFFFLQDSELDSPDIVPSAFSSNEGQNQNQSLTTGNSNVAGLPNPQQAHTQSQQQPQIPSMPQPKPQQQPPSNAPIPTQTFTNQSFPPIVPPPSMFPPQSVQNPNEIQNSQPQISVFTGPPLPIPQMVASAVPVVTTTLNTGTSQNSGAVLKSVENQQQAVIITNQAGLITGPSGANVPLPGFTNVVSSKFSPVPVTQIGIHHNQKSQDNYEKMQKSSHVKGLNENQIHKKMDDMKEILDRSNETSSDWDTNDNVPKPPRMSKNGEESNQWSNEVANHAKSNEWSNSYENQTESNSWNSGNNQNDGGYGIRNNRNTNFGGNNRPSGGSRGIRNASGNNGGGPPSNGYRGNRSNNSYQQQQNSRSSGIYFRNNNDNSNGSYYQNQNGGYNSGGGKQDGGGSYGSGNMNNNYRPRGGPIPTSNRQQSGGVGGRSGGGVSSNSGSNPPQRNNMNANRSNGGMPTNSNRPGDRNTGRAGNYGSSRPPPNVRQQPQQDVNV